jgi:hypothetical protein
VKRIPQLIASILLLTGSSLLAHAQTPTAVPVPSLFATAQTVFLGAGGAPALGNKAQLVTNMTYESVYRALSGMNKYRLVAAPADSTILMEVSILISVGTGDNQFNSASLRLITRDTRTHALLWIIDEPIDGAFREKTFQKNVGDATARIIDELRTLSTGSLPGEKSSTATAAAAAPVSTEPCASPKQPRTRISQESQEKQQQ